MRPISLHQLVTPEATPAELVRLAAGLGCAHVCLFTQAPVAGAGFPVADDAGLAEVLQAMAETGVSAYGVTSFPVHAQVDVASYEPALARSARLGARYASVRILDPDEGRAAQAFATLAALCSRHGLVASIEFTGYRTPEVLPRTLRLLDAAGAGALSIDPLHIVRTQVPLTAMQALAPSRIGYVQLCDGPLQATAEDYRRESAATRLAPGEGEFPLAEILALAPSGRAVSLEVPDARRREAGEPAETRARRVVEATRRLLAELEPD
jgi:sugar phosphate isomerase/epimerase